MSAILPIPSTRVADYLARQRLTQQVQTNQLELFRLQNQVSTGRRLYLPSDDAPAALRVVSLQRILERKAQVQKSLTGTESFLAAADNALSGVSSIIADIRANALGVADTVTTPQQRQAVVEQVERALQQLVDSGNAGFQGRYLFSGSRSQLPYEWRDGFVEYRGNETDLRNYVEVDLLMESNIPGSQVFGGISSEVRGTTDLNPQAAGDTLLSQINDGAGISPNGSIEITYTSAGSSGLISTSVIDLSRAATLFDVAKIIEDGAPAGSNLMAEVAGGALRLSVPTGTFVINEVAAGRTARELGIYTGPESSTDLLVGSNLQPQLLPTTPISDLLGTKAQGRLIFSGGNNDLVLTASANGSQYNDLTIEIITGATAGSETATYDASTNTLTATIQNGVTTGSQLAAAINAEGTFRAEIDFRDAFPISQAGTGKILAAPVPATYTGVTDSGGSGRMLDTVSGLIVTNGGDAMTVDTSAARTVEDLLNILNHKDLGLYAQINAAGDGIDVRTRRSGADLTIAENGGTTATDLGIRTYTEATRLAGMNRGVGVQPKEGSDDLVIVARDEAELSIDLSSAVTVGDVLDLINSHVANNVGTTAVEARLAATGNGIELVDTSTDPGSGLGALTVRMVEGSQAATLLGFVPAGATEVVADGGSPDRLVSEDRHTFETESVFNTLLRLREALLNHDIPAIGRTIEQLDEDHSRVNFARSEAGARLQSLELLKTRLEDENVTLRTVLSENLDVDLAEAISNYTARQYALQASLQTSANLLQLTLLNFI